MRWGLVALFVLATWPASALTAITGPGTHSTTGDYYLASDINGALTFTGSGRVKLNLNGKTVSGADTCITAHGNTSFIVEGGGESWIRDCRIGILSDRPWTRIQEVIFEDIRYMAMDLRGHTSRVILNEIEGPSGVTDKAYSVGVNAAGDGVIIRGNRFRNFYRQPASTPEMVGEGVPVILHAKTTGALVEQNFIANDSAAAGTIGVFAGAGGGHVVRNNTVINYELALSGGRVGASEFTENVLWLHGALEGSIGIFAENGEANDNVIIGYETAIDGQIPQSGNLAIAPDES